MGQRFDSFSFFDGTSMTPVTQVTWADYWRGVIPDGVVAGIGNEMKPYGNSTGMVAYIDTGAIMIDNHRAVIDTAKALPLAAADPSYDRIDVIVARVAYGNEDESYVELDVLTGTAEADPTAPAITQTTGGVYEVKLAEVTIRAGVVTITANDVSDFRSVYAGGEASRSWKNNELENMVRGDVVMMDKAEEDAILKVVPNQIPMGVVTSEVIAPGAYGKIESISGKIAEVRCTEDAVTMGDALVVSDQPGLAKAGAGWAAGVALQAKASGLIGNVRSLLAVYTQLPIQNKWWIPEGLDDENVIAAFRFAGVGSMEDALKDIAAGADGSYDLERTGNTVTWSSTGGFIIPAVSSGRAGLNSANLNSAASSILSAAVRYSDATVEGKRLSLMSISVADRALHANALSCWEGLNATKYSALYGPAIGGKRAADVTAPAAGVIAGNFEDKTKVYIDGRSYVTSTPDHSIGGGSGGVTNVTLGQFSYSSDYPTKSGAAYNIICAVFFDVALTADQMADIAQKMKGL